MSIDKIKNSADRKKKEPISRIEAVGLGAVALAVATGVAVAHEAKVEDTPRTDESKTYAELAADSAKQSYDPSKDTIFINGIKIMPNNPNRDSPSQAVLNHPDVVAFMDAHPDEVASLESSSLALDSLDTEMAVVGRDIDDDGDMDAVAVSVDSK